MALKIEDDFMALQIDGRVIATARFSQDAAPTVTELGPSLANTAACSPATKRSRR